MGEMIIGALIAFVGMLVGASIVMAAQKKER